MENTTLRAGDAFIVLIDLQEGIINVGVTAEPARLRTCAGALAQLATSFAIPIVLSCVPTTSGTVAPPLAEILQHAPTATQSARTTANAMEDRALRTALEASKRRTIILAGVASDVAVAQAALAAHRLGYAVVVAVDACSGLDARTESATFTHLSASSIGLSSVAAIAAELGNDFTSESGRAAMRSLQSIVALNAHAHSHAGDDDDQDSHDDHAHHEHATSKRLR